MHPALLTEALLIGLAAGVLLVYHVWLWQRLRRAPQRTALGRSNEIRAGWVQTVMTERRDILAVQTLRNWTMAATFLASTAMLIGLGALSIALTTEKLTDLAHLFNVFGVHGEIAWAVKLICLAMNFFSAFFHFTLAVRYYNHVGFMINVGPAAVEGVNAETVTRTLNRGARHYTLGMRGYYLTIPISLWLLGPTWALLGALVLTALLAHLDRAD